MIKMVYVKLLLIGWNKVEVTGVRGLPVRAVKCGWEILLPVTQKLH
jgi:hypothetical protein